MGAMSATLHVVTVGAGGSIDELWDLCEEMAQRAKMSGGPVLHATDGEREADGPRHGRYCFHPSGDTAVEFRADAMHDAMVAGATWLAAQLPQDDVWRRD